MLDFDQATAALTRAEISPTDYLQNAYITNNPNAENLRYKLARAIGQHDYHKVHEQAHSWLFQIIENNDLKDLFLINTDGMVVYSVRKSKILPYRLKMRLGGNNNLAKAFRRVERSRKPEITIFRGF